ncbi:MAG: hypothetical protein MUP81_03175 [Dehalococcoidia bacterium]|nr:hypothetical protein [Dehalococcoidia bacterium]
MSKKRYKPIGSKFTNLYGKTAKELAAHFGIKLSKIYSLDGNGELQRLLEQEKKKEANVQKNLEKPKVAF